MTPRTLVARYGPSPTDGFVGWSVYDQDARHVAGAWHRFNLAQDYARTMGHPIVGIGIDIDTAPGTLEHVLAETVRALADWSLMAHDPDHESRRADHVAKADAALYLLGLVEEAIAYRDASAAVVQEALDTQPHRWVPCSPALLGLDVDCGKTIRRPDGVTHSHDHLVPEKLIACTFADPEFVEHGKHSGLDVATCPYCIPGDDAP